MEEDSSLLCTENQACLDDQEEEQVEENEFINLKNNDYFSILSETQGGDDYIKMLVERESSFESKVVGSSEDWLKCARLDAIKWILKTRESFGFRFQTAYMSMTYMDRFLSKKSIDSGKSWAIRLLSIACLSVAVKMEECNIPALSEFQMGEYNFKSKVIQRMELLVLNTLQWRMSSITPFAYLHCFIARLSDTSRPKDLASRTVELIFAVAKETDLLDYRPSAIAVAAILAALNKRLTREMLEFKMSFISPLGSLQDEDVFSCYNLLKDVEIEKFKLPKCVISPDLSPIYSSSGNTNIYEDSGITSVAGSNKRRRLTFHDYDQNCKIHDEKQN